MPIVPNAATLASMAGSRGVHLAATAAGRRDPIMGAAFPTSAEGD
ncbi:MAG: hypothetical protein ABWY64_12130 [Tardiphaga sp.]|jgi:hypothetical protein